MALTMRGFYFQLIIVNRVSSSFSRSGARWIFVYGLATPGDDAPRLNAVTRSTIREGKVAEIGGRDPAVRVILKDWGRQASTGACIDL